MSSRRRSMLTTVTVGVGAALAVAWTLSGSTPRSAGAGDGHAGHAPAAGKTSTPVAPGPGMPMPPKGAGDLRDEPATPAGYAHVPLPAGTAARLDLVTARVEPRRLQRTVRTVGVVALDETRTAHVHAKVRGWIEAIDVLYAGQAVRQGEALCAIYSPEVYAAQLELVALLHRTPRAPAAETDPFTRAEDRVHAQTVAAARRRLQLWDVPAEAVRRLQRTRRPERTFTLAAPRDGVVTALTARAGLYVDAATELYTLTDLSRVWVLADVYEADAPHVGLGTPARLRVAGLAESPRQASVTFAAPTLDEATRTQKVRFELDNADGALKPGAFVTVEIDVDLGTGLAVPEAAVVRTGTQDVVFVVLPTHVEPRAVEIGPLADGFARVVAGLQAGDVVAVNGQFLLDSDSRMRATGGQGGGHGH